MKTRGTRKAKMKALRRSSSRYVVGPRSATTQTAPEKGLRVVGHVVIRDRVISAPPERMRDMRELADNIGKRYSNVIDALSKL